MCDLHGKANIATRHGCTEPTTRSVLVFGRPTRTVRGGTRIWGGAEFEKTLILENCSVREWNFCAVSTLQNEVHNLDVKIFFQGLGRNPTKILTFPGWFFSTLHGGAIPSESVCLPCHVPREIKAGHFEKCHGLFGNFSTARSFGAPTINTQGYLIKSF